MRRRNLRNLIGGLGVSFVLAAVAWAAEPKSMGPPFTVPTDSDGVQRTTVILDSYSYEPAHLVVEKGKPVELTLKSVTTFTPHNFIIKDPAGSLSVEQDVSAGKTTILKFTPMQSGIFPIYCDKRLWPLPSHRDKGMEGKLEVR
jgi:heme/copper-type cytochrome/quinol oxidase subunit 2